MKKDWFSRIIIFAFFISAPLLFSAFLAVAAEKGSSSAKPSTYKAVPVAPPNPTPSPPSNIEPAPKPLTKVPEQQPTPIPQAKPPARSTIPAPSNPQVFIPTTKPPVLKPTITPPAHEPTTTPPAHKPTTKPPVLKPTTAPPAHKPTTTPPVYKPTAKPPSSSPTPVSITPATNTSQNKAPQSPGPSPGHDKVVDKKQQASIPDKIIPGTPKTDKITGNDKLQKAFAKPSSLGLPVNPVKDNQAGGKTGTVPSASGDTTAEKSKKETNGKGSLRLSGSGSDTYIGNKQVTTEKGEPYIGSYAEARDAIASGKLTKAQQDRLRTSLGLPEDSDFETLNEAIMQTDEMKNAVRETFGIPADKEFTSAKDALDFAAKGERVGAELTPEDWNRWSRGEGDQVINDAIRKNLGIGPGSEGKSTRELLKIGSEANMMGVDNITPEFIKDFENRQNGVMSVKDFVNKYAPDADWGGNSNPSGGRSGSGNNTEPETDDIGGDGNTLGGMGGNGLNPGVVTLPRSPASDSMGQTEETFVGGDVGGASEGAGGVESVGSSPGHVANDGTEAESPEDTQGLGTTPGTGNLPGGQEQSNTNVTDKFVRFTSDGQGGYTGTAYGITGDGSVVELGSEHFSPNEDGTLTGDDSGQSLTGDIDENYSYALESNNEDGSSTLAGMPDNPDSGNGEDPDNSGDDSGGSDDDSGGDNTTDNDTTTDDTTTDDTTTDDTTTDGTTTDGTTDDDSEEKTGMPNPDAEPRIPLTAEDIAALVEEVKTERKGIVNPGPESSNLPTRVLDREDIGQYNKSNLDPVIHTSGDDNGTTSGGGTTEQLVQDIEMKRGSLVNPPIDGNTLGPGGVDLPKENEDPHGGNPHADSGD